MNKKILITGASGFIGSHLLDYLLVSQKLPPETIRVLIRETSSKKYIADHKEVDVVVGDLRDKKSLIKATRGIDVVYHLASIVRFKSNNEEDFNKTNVLGTKYLLDACKKNKVKKFIYFSSIAVYGLPAFAGDIINWSEKHPFTYSEAYGRSKYEGEELVRSAHVRWGLATVIIRPVSVYGPRDDGQLFGFFKAVKNKHFFIIGDGKNLLHFIYVGDLVKAARKAEILTKKSSDYIIGGDTISLSGLAVLISKNLDVPLRKFHLGKNTALALSFLLEIAGRIVGTRPPLFPERVKTMTTTYFYDTSKMKNQLMFTPPTSLKKGIKITTDWYLKERAI